MNSLLKSLFVVVAASLPFSESANAEVLYADTFTGTNNTALGKTSTGAYSWVSSDTSTYIYYYNNGARIAYANEASAPSLSAYVNFDLDQIANYDISVDIRIPNTATTTPIALIAPRTETVSTVNMGAISGAFGFQRSSNSITVGTWNGSTFTTVMNTGLALGNTGTGSDAFYTTHFTIRGNVATLVSIAEVQVNTSITLDAIAGNGTADFLLFGNIPVEATAQSMNFRYTNLSLTQIPEPRMALASLIALVFCLNRFRRTS